MPGGHENVCPRICKYCPESVRSLSPHLGCHLDHLSPRQGRLSPAPHRTASGHSGSGIHVHAAGTAPRARARALPQGVRLGRGREAGDPGTLRPGPDHVDPARRTRPTPRPSRPPHARGPARAYLDVRVRLPQAGLPASQSSGCGARAAGDCCVPASRGCCLSRRLCSAHPAGWKNTGGAGQWGGARCGGRSRTRAGAGLAGEGRGQEGEGRERAGPGRSQSPRPAYAPAHARAPGPGSTKG